MEAFIIPGLAVAATLAFALVAWRLRGQKEEAIAKSRRARLEADQLREQFAKVSGWTADGRLPDNWADIVRSKLAAPAAEETGAGPAEASLLSLALKTLADAGPPAGIFPERKDTAEIGHERTLAVLGRLAADEREAETLLVNGDLDHLISTWLRLDTYFPAAPQTPAYMAAAAAVCIALQEQRIMIIAPRPLSVVHQQDADFSSKDIDNLKRNPAIRSLVSEAASRQSAYSRDEGLVVDCISPGWSRATEVQVPRVLVWDRSWQE